MAEPRGALSIVAILAIVILVGLVVYFVMEETDDDIEIDFNLVPSNAPAQVAAAPEASLTSAPLPIGFAAD